MGVNKIKGSNIMNESISKYKLWRYSRGLGLIETAKMFKIGVSTLQKIENGERVSDKSRVYIDTMIEKIEEQEEK